MSLISIIATFALIASVPIGSSQASSFDLCYPFCEPLVWQSDEMTCDLNAEYWASIRFADSEFKLDLTEGEEISLEHFEGFRLPRFPERHEVYTYITDLLLVVNPKGRVEAIYLREPCKPAVWELSEDDLARCRLASEIDTRMVELHKKWAFEPESITRNQTCSLIKIRYILSASDQDGGGGHLYRRVVGTESPEQENE